MKQRSSSRKFRKVEETAAVEPWQFCCCPKPKPCLFIPWFSPET